MIFSPLAVWLQSPRHAEKYKQAGINTYVGLWQGPTESQLSELQRHGMHVICGQNDMALARKDSPIIAWMHGDEPDNAQSLGKGKGYGPPVKPTDIIANYRNLQAADPTRPILLNLGQGVAWDAWQGRGVRTNHPEDYREYVKGADIVSFDIYPACHRSEAVAGKLWMVADGVTRLRKWSENRKLIWNCIETTRIDNESVMVTPQQVRAEVWMSLIRGSRGIIYFCHQFKPRFIEAGLLAEPEILAAVSATNLQIQRLASVLNQPSLEDSIVIRSPADRPVEATCKHHDAWYVFSVAMRGLETTARFELREGPRNGKVEVIGENRSLKLSDGVFTDAFAGWGVHLYRIAAN